MSVFTDILKHFAQPYVDKAEGPEKIKLETDIVTFAAHLETVVTNASAGIPEPFKSQVRKSLDDGIEKERDVLVAEIEAIHIKL